MATAEYLYPFAQDFILVTVIIATFILFLSLMDRIVWPRRSDHLSGEHTVEQSNNVFEGIAPQSKSKSESKKAPFEVFINHRGTDTKQTLASSIYDTLHEMGVEVFLDKEELELGDVIPAEIEEAMRTSFLHIAILSPHYAESPWCLAELSFMLKTGNRVIPVFYNVDPADVRYLKRPFADAFAEHRRKERYSPEKLKDWEEALQEVSVHSGHILKDNDDEGGLLKSIVNYVLKKKNKVSLVGAKHPVGLDVLIEDFEKNSLDSSKNVNIVGIVGMGGSGKTTLAKELYNKRISSFYKCSFVFDIRDAAANKNLHCKQKRLMEDLGFKDSNDLSFDNIEGGKAILKSKLSSLQVLIVLDDIDHEDQLDALLPITDFGRGSLIIVTSRESGVLQSWGISSIYDMKGLKPEHARELFCWHAFFKSSLPDEFQQEFHGLVEEFVQFCNGLPLSLKVFGGLLYGKSKEYWKCQLSTGSRILPIDIKGKLKISFDALDEEKKEIFLDIACFFIGEEKSSAIAVWDGSRWDGLHGWDVLVNKCLVEVDEHNRIKMHDQLRDLGREIAKERSPFRVWSPQQITDIQKQTTERVLIRGIRAETDDFYDESPYYDGTPFEECMELLKGCPTKSKALTPSILVVKGDYFTDKLATLFPALTWLRWSNMPGTALPSWLILKSLRVLELPDTYCLKELWNDTADGPSELRELNLAHARNFLSFPRSIKRLKHLKKISLTGADFLPMKSLPEEFCQLGSLEYLRLDSCNELTSLPGNFGNLTNLRHLQLSSCRKLTSLPGNLGNLTNLRHLQLSSCWKLTSLPGNFGNLTNLRHLDLISCDELTSLPGNFGNLTNLRHLDLISCRKLTSLPGNFGNLTNLRHLDLSSCEELTSLPGNFGNLTNLRHLQLRSCRRLRTLPDSFKQLRNLQHIIFRDCRELTFTSETLENMTKLETLDFDGCEKLEKLPRHITNQLSLRHLDVSCTGLRELPINIGELSKLEKLSIGGRFLTSLPESIGKLSSLTSLYTSDFTELRSLPESIGNLSCLRSLTILNMSGTLPKSIGNLSSLTSLFMSGESGTLPESIGNLSSLTSLHICYCGQLGTLPESIGNLSSLTRFSLSVCNKLKFLPETVGNLSSLSELRISECDELIAIPESVSHLSSLKVVQIERCPKFGSVILEPFRSLNRLEDNNAQLAKIESLEIRECPITELALLSGSFSSSFWNVKMLYLDNTPVSRISISQECCPSLELVELDSNEQLVEIERLPISVKDLTLMNSAELKNLDVLSGMVKLERLSIMHCRGELDELPSFANLLLLKEFEFEDDADQPMKIQGLENCRSLETVTAVTHWKWNVSAIQNLEHVEGLQRLYLSAECNISAFEPCLKTIKKWPSECIICAGGERGVESIMSSVAFRGLTLVDSCVEKFNEGGGGKLSLKGGQRRRSNQAAMVCFNINCSSSIENMKFTSEDIPLADYSHSDKWVCLGVFTEASRMREECTLEVDYSETLGGWWDGRLNDKELGRGELVIGEEEKVVEAFKQMTVTSGSVNRPKRRHYVRTNRRK